jgi:hypothetical protein
MSGLLVKTDLYREQRDFVETIQVCAQTLLSLVDDRPGLHRQAMALKDGASTIGANPLRDLAGNLADTAYNDPSQRTGDVARIRSELARVQIELGRHLKNAVQRSRADELDETLQNQPGVVTTECE